MQRWGSEQAAAGSVLLRTGALTSLATLGTAGLVLCGALAVGGPGSGGPLGALGRGPAAISADELDGPSVAAAPSQPRPTTGPDAPRRSRTATGPHSPGAVTGTALAGDALSGTVSHAVQLPADLDSVVRPARGRPAVIAVAPEPVMSAPQEVSPAGPTVRPARTGAERRATPTTPPPAPAPAAARQEVVPAAPKAAAEPALKAVPAVQPVVSAVKPKVVPAVKPKTAAPKTDKPTVDKPKADKPKADKPKADEPEADKPEADKPRGEPAGQAKGHGTGH